jgi:hypothetical protein
LPLLAISLDLCSLAKSAIITAFIIRNKST